MNTSTLFVTDIEGLVSHNHHVDKKPDFASEVFDTPSRTLELVEQIKTWEELATGKPTSEPPADETSDGRIASGSARAAIQLDTSPLPSGMRVFRSSREATDEELLRNGCTSRRYLNHFKKLSRKVQQHSNAGGRGNESSAARAGRGKRG
eukprot:CAMPEP_0118956162 /NCGR_PEP_ID=MMETSP1169-20130426/61235_1 /TAXON_ID=36882 /ORGANISM="Pyramimonas obovata, Strain CCMP722" /LENGTH=149 /DNA_ID=CAMNT_0006904143 /DNA_START=119 /DNA_END=565 /DNA_ORIENTATION=+